MELLLALILGIGVGCIFSRNKPIGYLRVDRSDPTESPYLFLELKAHPDVLSKCKYVVLEVKNENFISHE